MSITTNLIALLLKPVPAEDQANVSILLACTPIPSVSTAAPTGGSKRRRADKEASKKRSAKKASLNGEDQATDLSLKSLTASADSSAETKKRKKSNEDQQATLLSGLASGLLAAAAAAANSNSSSTCSQSAAIGAEPTEAQAPSLMNGTSSSLDSVRGDDAQRSDIGEESDELDEGKLAALFTSSSLQQLLLAKSAAAQLAGNQANKNRAAWSAYDELMQQTRSASPSDAASAIVAAAAAAAAANHIAGEASGTSHNDALLNEGSMDADTMRANLQQHLMQQLQQVQQQQKELAGKKSNGNCRNTKNLGK